MPREHIVQLRVNDAERDYLTTMAVAHGTTVGGYLRRKLGLNTPVPDLNDRLDRIEAALARMGGMVDEIWEGKS